MTDTSGFAAYRNSNTGELYVLSGPSPDLEARPNFVRVEVDQVPPHMIDQARQARAAQEAVEASARIHARRTEVSGEEAARAAGVAATSTESPAGFVVNERMRLAGENGGVGVLSRHGVRDIQIGDDPKIHPRTDAELAAVAAYEAQHPDPRGVLDPNRVAGSPEQLAAIREGRTPPQDPAEPTPAEQDQGDADDSDGGQDQGDPQKGTSGTQSGGDSREQDSGQGDAGNPASGEQDGADGQDDKSSPAPAASSEQDGQTKPGKAAGRKTTGRRAGSGS